ncbi:Rhodanese-like protein [Coemansia reversa NRRL 1564]|uniref:Rhodanese-like protein n=1 Tax=Coemansia reversa (strain ATCC 12441 / NRRL 1564) TaxID=763665 RepID=A0A2G5B536_COERN|nr:Rhodanese-like protein [Coemansia reversa NRRL 1564]|eukprot:PIA14111.1 Rhodanese-like protein [Coemansia reversa NRRL 1564]
MNSALVSIVIAFVVVRLLSSIIFPTMSKNAKQLSLDDILVISKSGKLNKSPITIVDVRSPEEFSSGHIKNAHNVPVQELQGALKLSSDDFKKKYHFKLPPANGETGLAVYCMSGKRAGLATNHLAEAKYLKNLYAYLPGWSEFSHKATAADIATTK